jgi:hypothetical protein
MGNTMTNITLHGVYLGYCVIGDYVVIFSKDNDYDYIYKYQKDQQINGVWQFIETKLY